MNRRLFLALTLALALCAWPVPAAEIYMSADDYMMASKQERWGFVQGVYDTYGTVARQSTTGDAALGRIARCTEKTSVNELERTFTAWLDAHSERWNERMPALFLDALEDQCSSSGANSGASSSRGVNAATTD
jgi:hypothetical protein